ncbi:MAG: ATP-dependent sacrificial sulfur transferase LarE [Chloroflexi bacterium]|nr:ATP-dependent sacrificial sulfur transferase LarE [Chloroflexota bacterium]
MSNHKVNIRSKTADKTAHLHDVLGKMSSAIVGYSGGVDSTYLAATARDILKEKVLIVLANSPVMDREDFKNAVRLAASLSFDLQQIAFNQLDVPDFAANGKDRCYHCKLTMLGMLNEMARARRIKYVCDGSNYDDLSDYRPGLVAVSELGVRSPLAESFLTKKEIRSLAKTRGLPNWDKPAMPCLATRVPHHTPITHHVLRKVSAGESFIRSLGVRQVRLRHHDDIARIEVDEPGFRTLLKKDNRRAAVEAVRKLGYKHVTIDLAGYQMGSMNP